MSEFFSNGHPILFLGLLVSHAILDFWIGRSPVTPANSSIEYVLFAIVGLANKLEAYLKKENSK